MLCENICKMHKNPVNCFLHLIAGIILIYALWNHNLLLILIGVLVALTGHIIQSAGSKKTDKTEKRKRGKRAALELSIGTIVIIVIAITMLILGIVFVRSIMCGAINLTGDLNDRVKGEVNDLFGATGGEVQCIGSTGEPISMEPGKINLVYCGVKAPQEAKYSVTVTDYSATYSTKSEIKSWMVDDSWEGTVAPNDEIPKKVARLNIPKEAPEDSITIQVVIKKEGTVISTQDLDFKISRSGFFRAAMC